MKSLIIKCEYCGKSYEVKKAHDACPYCGSFNEFDYDFLIQKRKALNNKGDSSKVVFKVFLGIILAFLTIAIIGGVFSFFHMGGYYYFIDDYEYNPDDFIEYEFDYSEDLINEPNAFLGKNGNSREDYYKTITVNGSFDDLYNKVYTNIYTNQFNMFNISVNPNIKLTKENNNFYIDQIELHHYSNLTGCDLHIDTEGNFKVKDVEVYFISGDRRDRFSVDDWEDITLKEVFNKGHKDRLYGHIASSSFRIYDTIEIIIDNETYSYPLEYKDSSCFIQYYGLENSTN